MKANVDDSNLVEVIRDLCAELQSLGSRVDSLESENRLLKFELIRLNGELGTENTREMQMRSFARSSELKGSAEPVMYEGGSRPNLLGRLTTIEQKIVNDAEGADEDGNINQFALGLTRCLSCKTPVPSKTRQHPPVDNTHKIQKGTTLFESSKATARPLSAPNGNFQLAAVGSLSEKQYNIGGERTGGKGDISKESKGVTVHVGGHSTHQDLGMPNSRHGNPTQPTPDTPVD